MNRSSSISAFAFAVLFCQTVFAELIPVTQAQFGPSTLREIFNEPINYGNAVDSPDKDYTGSMVIMGTNSPYVFTNTGVTYVSPVPNQYGPWLQTISLLKGNQYFNFGYYGEFLPDYSFIPGGFTAGNNGVRFLLETGSSSVHFPPFMLVFPGEGASKVGLYPIMAGSGVGHDPSLDRIVITAYDAQDNLLGTLYAPPTMVASWRDNFVGFESDNGAPIHKIGITYSDNQGASRPGIANLTFEPVVAGTPEPSSLVLLASGIICLLYIRRRYFSC